MFELEALKPNDDGTYHGEGPKVIPTEEEFVSNVRQLRSQGFAVSVNWHREPRDHEADDKLLSRLAELGVVVRN